MIYFLLSTNIITLFFLIVLARKHSALLDDTEDNVEKIEDCLDTLDENYTKMSKFLETPVLFDDPIAIEFVQTAKNARDSLLIVANKLVAEKEK